MVSDLFIYCISILFPLVENHFVVVNLWSYNLQLTLFFYPTVLFHVLLGAAAPAAAKAPEKPKEEEVDPMEGGMDMFGGGGGAKDY